MNPTPPSSVDSASSASVHATAKLSPREIEIVCAIASGKSSKEIAAELGVSPKTIESHRTNIFRKLGCRCAADVVRYAIRESLIEP